MLNSLSHDYPLNAQQARDGVGRVISYGSVSDIQIIPIDPAIGALFNACHMVNPLPVQEGLAAKETAFLCFTVTLAEFLL